MMSRFVLRFRLGPTVDHAVQGRSNATQHGPRSPILGRARVAQGQFWRGWTWPKVGSSEAYCSTNLEKFRAWRSFARLCLVTVTSGVGKEDERAALSYL